MKIEGNLDVGIRGSGFFKPYFVWDGKESREVTCFHFFTDQGILFSETNAWLSNEKGHLIKAFSVKCDHYISNKLKPKYDLKVPFLIKAKKPRFTTGDHKYAEVYIPFNLLNWACKEMVFEHETPKDKVYGNYWVTGDVWIRTKLIYKPIHKNVQFIFEVTPLAELLGVEYINEHTLIENRDAIIKHINELNRSL